MVYTAPDNREWRQNKGALSEKITTELGLIATELATTQGEEVVRDFPMSFETAGVMNLKVYFPYKVTINKIRSIVTKALADTDVGTITCGNATGPSTGGVVTVALSAALGEEDVATPTTNNVVAADSYYYLTTAKTTAGGEVLVSLECTRTA